jgi:hypothetical protein
MHIKRILQFLLPILLLSLLASSLLWPSAARPLAWTALCLGLGLAVYAIVRRDRLPYQQGLIPRKAFVRRLVIDLSGLLLSTIAAIGVAGWAGRMTAQAVWNASSLVWAALLASLAAGLVVGAVVGLLMRRMWQLVTRPFLANTASKAPPAA